MMVYSAVDWRLLSVVEFYVDSLQTHAEFLKYTDIVWSDF